MFYGPKIIQASGFSDGNVLNLAVGGWNFITTLVAIFLVGKLGRRALFLLGTAILTVALIGIALTFNLTDECSNQTSTVSFAHMRYSNELQANHTACPRVIGVTVGLIVFILGFEMGPGCLFWVLANEMFPKRFSELGASYTNIAQWGFNLLVSSTFAFIPQDVAFYVFAGAGVVCTVYLFLFLKEPQDKGIKFERVPSNS